MEKELVLKESVKKLEEITDKIDGIIKECLPITTAQRQGIADALILAKGVSLLRDFILNNDGIKSTIKAMQDTKLGFMTDRTPDAIEASKKKKYPLTPYSYKQIAECCIEALLKGYRLTDNEFNIIAGNFYPAKNGKYRKIIETEGLTDFKFGTTTPVYKTETRINYQGRPESVEYAQVSCYASWKINGVLVKRGQWPGDEQKREDMSFKIKVHSSTGDDAVVGKALSKLFSRVLLNISGKLLEESTDVTQSDKGEVIDAEISAEDLSEQIKGDKSMQPESEIDLSPKGMMDLIDMFAKYDISDVELYAYCGKEESGQLTKDDIKKLDELSDKLLSGEITPDDIKKQAADEFEKNYSKEKNSKGENS